MSGKPTILCLLILTCFHIVQAQPKTSPIVVDQNGHGNFTSIQAALNSLPDDATAPRVILVKKGLYREKLYLEKRQVVLQGEDRESTIISQSIPRDQWRCLHNDDWGVATINVDANDISLVNLTVLNNYGFDNDAEQTIACPLDTITHTRKIQRSGHQMALRTMNSTRLKAVHCRFAAYGGDTVSPWNVGEGMFYFKDCIMEGGVDFYCPRGWAYAEKCVFIAHSGTASVWHDGSVDKDSKSVIRDSEFRGFDGFKLGRYHKDAQIFLLSCRFADNMANEDIDLVPTNYVIRWGRRIYYFGCHRQAGDYAWFANNIDEKTANNISPAWLFGDKWNPAG
jgi:pectinesterase